MYGQGNYFWNADNWSKLERELATVILKALKEHLLSAGQWAQIKASAGGDRSAFAAGLAAHLNRSKEGLLEGLWGPVFKLEHRLSRVEVWPRDGTNQWDLAEIIWENIVTNQLKIGVSRGANKFVHTLCRKLANPKADQTDQTWRNLINQALLEQRSIAAAQQLNLHYGGPLVTPTEVEEALFVLEEQVRRCCEFLARWESFPELAQALLGRSLVPGRKDLDVHRAVLKQQITPDLAWRWNEMSESIVVAMAQHDGKRLTAKWRERWVRRLDRIDDLKDCKTPEARADKLNDLLQLLYFVQTSAPGDQVLVDDFDALRRVRKQAVADDGDIPIGHVPEDSYPSPDGDLWDDADRLVSDDETCEEQSFDDDLSNPADAEVDNDPGDSTNGVEADEVLASLEDAEAIADLTLPPAAWSAQLEGYSLAYQIGLLLKAWKGLRGDFEAQQHAGAELLAHFQACDLFNRLGCDKHRLEAVSEAKLAKLESQLQGKAVSTASYQRTLAALWPEFTERVADKLRGKHADNP